MKRFRITKVPAWAKSVNEGDTVYPFTSYDYNLAHEDTVAFGKEHVAVSLEPANKGPFFTCPLEDLEEIP